jgi:beta-mannosidase
MKIFIIRVCLLIPIAIGIDFCLGQNVSVDLNKNWQFRKASEAKWYKAEVPGTVHTDLLANKLIPDPFYRDNESKVQWVENETWEYKLVFNIDEKAFVKKHIELRFEGLDTYAQTWLNGENILNADNMFHDWTVDIKHLAKRKNNVLTIRFIPSAEFAKQLKSTCSLVYPDNERVFVRKAQYQFGWDWGPRLVTCGIWKPVRLEAYDKVVKQKERKLPSWNVKLVTSKDSIGESFLFTKNGKPVFIKGANWIPADNFLPRAKKLKKFEMLIKAAKEANINMLRVWGGGIYEEDVFYELCDKYGIMVWQDFMFAGALYPADPVFLQSVEQEVRYQVNRLKKHPCIVIWCGNNEIEEAWFNWGWQKQFNYSKEDSLRLWKDYKKIFHELIPSIVKELDPSRSYWPSSPSLGWGRDSAYLKGDVHYWGVWWGREPVEKYNEKVGRFNSEYGMQGMPDLKTINQFALPSDLDTASKVMKVHQKHPFGYENIKLYIENKFRTPKTFEDLVYVSQLMQADAIKTAIEAHRTSPKSGGTIFWQWNDCWPVTSWSAIDYYGRKKALYFAVKRSFRQYLSYLINSENQIHYGVVADNNDENLEIHLWLMPLDPTVPNINRYKNNISSSSHRVNASEVDKLFPECVIDTKRQYVQIFVLKKNGISQPIVSSSEAFLLDDPKNVEFGVPKIQWSIEKNELQLVSDKFAYGVFIDVPDGVELEDNYFNLLPGETKYVKFTSILSFEEIKKSLRIKSLVDTYTK